MRRLAPLLAAGTLGAAIALAVAHAAAPQTPAQASTLPRIGAAPAFALKAQDGRPLALADLRGKVVVLDFIFTSCADTCPLQTRKLAQLRSQLGPDAYFVSITLDPEHDSPAVLRSYAQRQGADLTRWAFLTGDPARVRDIARRYGVFAGRSGDGNLVHNVLTSVIDRGGSLRVQYLGVRYDLAELRSDVLALARERGPL